MAEQDKNLNQTPGQEEAMAAGKEAVKSELDETNEEGGQENQNG